MPTQLLSHDILNAAIEGLEQKKLHIDSQIAELRGLLSGDQHEASAPKSGTTKKKRSAESIQRMREGQQRRWARQNGPVEPQSGPVKKSNAKRKMSAAGRANIVAALKKRWAAKKASGKAAKKA